MEICKSYKCDNKEVQRTVRDAKLKANDDLYTRLDIKEGEKFIYKLAKLREGKTRDVKQVKCIKSDNSKVLVKNDEMRISRSC